MRIAYLTAGAAGMYCGSCLRDAMLVTALRAQGRDVSLVPLFTPIRTDRNDPSETCVSYGALNVYLQHKSGLFRAVPSWLTRPLDDPRLLRGLTHWSGKETMEDLGRLTVSTLSGRGGNQAREVNKLIARLRRVRPDVVNLPNAMFVHLARPIREEVGAAVACTLTGEDIFIDKMPEPWRGRVVDLIRTQANDVDAFIAVSRYYADECRRRFGISADRLHTVPSGIPIDPAREAEPPLPFTIGYMARISPDKGFHLLCDALSTLRKAGREVRVLAGGHLGAADRTYYEVARKRLAAAGIAEHLEYRGEVDLAGKLDLLRSCHVLCVPTVYREPKALFALEALSQGVPIVAPQHGVFREIIQDTGGGVLVPPGDPAALAAAIAALMDSPERRQALGRAGRAAVLERFTDRHMADQTWAVYERLTRAGA